MEYSISATSIAGNDASLVIKQSEIAFGTTDASAEKLPNPAELFLGSFAACILKNVERFSGLLHFEYDRASIKVSAARLENPLGMDDIRYELTIFSGDEKLRIRLLKKNIEKYGTIFNTVKRACSVSGSIIKKGDV
ncbi:MAG: OsmC family protein [Saprospiraceae bacterium]|nr:OsmC family protein [Saprospiraceae bacterium]MCF8250550.1 OsmC family protein [Saprospiraceae bacterium]MCF8279690.1 OsmC family protein [Bacteroidales bacterium]MCF8312476.1 OsmC family protein [Saprospiraceae bacterium]MCF8440707.1 OsmC family protein [Saprospiraceae bacterium]